MRRPGVTGTVKVLLAVEVMCAIFGFIGGIMFFADPSGKSFGLESKLATLPVSDFLLVGVWLFVVYGVGFSLISYALRGRKTWAWIGALGLSMVWVVWVGLETYLWGVDFFVDMWLVPPLLGLLLLLWPGARGQLASSRAASPAA